jgi:predicted metal-dependent peptidase
VITTFTASHSTSELSRKAAERVSRARARLVLDAPWYGALALRLRLRERADAETCAGLSCDATHLSYIPAKVMALSDRVLMGMVAHETLHCALLHPFRGKGRDWKIWNQACDFAINGILVEHGFELWEGALYAEEFKNHSAEQVYAVLRQLANEQQKQQGEEGQDGDQSEQGSPMPDGAQGDPDGPQPQMEQPPKPEPEASKQDEQPEGDDQDGQGQGGDEGQGEQDKDNEGSGDGQDGSDEDETEPEGQEPTETPQTPPTTPEPKPLGENDWAKAAEQATLVGRKAGKLPGDMDRHVTNSRESTTDWREVLRRFVEQTQPSDYSWSRPNRRFISQGLYLPGTVKENVGRIVIAVDTSGSITEEMLNVFGSEVTAILHEARPSEIEVVYCDARIQGVERFTPDDAEVKLSAKGGGGTGFRPVFEHVQDTSEMSGEAPVALVYLTDLKNYAETLEEPPYPVLWVTPEWVQRTKPAAGMTGEWGEVVRVPIFEDEED